MNQRGETQGRSNRSGALEMSKPSREGAVSVIIPTMLRPELLQAVESVNNQSLPRRLIEIVLVVDLAHVDMDTDVESLRIRLSLLRSDRIILTGGGQRGGGARQMGVEASTGSWIAFLDDDDFWDANKLDVQLKLATRSKTSARGLVLSCRVRQVHGALAKAGVNEIPRQLMRDDERVEDYLFRRRILSAQRASLFTSTLLISADLARAVPWNADLPRHQDWDWLVRATRLPDTRLVQTQEVLATIRLGSPNSISARSDWKSSLRWVENIAGDWSRWTVSDFLAAQTLRYALQARSLRGVWLTVAAIGRTRCPPSLSCVSIGLAGLLGRSTFERMLMRHRRH